MRELYASHCTARRLALKAYHAGRRSGYSSWSSSLTRRKAPLPWTARASLRPARSLVSVGEVGHVQVPDPGRQRINDDQIQLVEVGRDVLQIDEAQVKHKTKIDPSTGRAPDSENPARGK
jgi:hypothetical protein